MVKTVKMSDENYLRLTKLAGKLQSEWGKPVSIDAALEFMQKSREISEFSGAWQGSEKQTQKTVQGIKERWRTWGLDYLKQRAKKE